MKLSRKIEAHGRVSVEFAICVAGCLAYSGLLASHCRFSPPDFVKVLIGSNTVKPIESDRKYAVVGLSESPVVMGGHVILGGRIHATSAEI